MKYRHYVLIYVWEVVCEVPFQVSSFYHQGEQKLFHTSNRDQPCTVWLVCTSARTFYLHMNMLTAVNDLFSLLFTSMHAFN